MINPNASTQKRVTISKILLLVVALVAAWVTSLKPGDILFLVGAAFSLAAAAFFPPLALDVLEARQQIGGDRWHGAGPWHHDVLHGHALSVLPKSLGLNPADYPQWFGIRRSRRRSSASRSAYSGSSS